MKGIFDFTALSLRLKVSLVQRQPWQMHGLVSCGETSRFIRRRIVRKRATDNFFTRSSRNPRTLKNASARAREMTTIVTKHGIRIIIPPLVYAFSFLKHAYHTRVPNRHAARALRESMTSRPAFTDWLAVLRVWCTTVRMSSTDGSLSILVFPDRVSLFQTFARSFVRCKVAYNARFCHRRE